MPICAQTGSEAYRRDREAC